LKEWENLETSHLVPWREWVIRHAPHILVGIIFIVLIPMSSTYIKYLAARMLIYALFALSLNLLFGYTGLFPLGHAAYLGLGGYTAGILVVRLGIHSFWAVAPVSILITACVAAVFGIIALQTRGLLFAFITMALGQLLVNVAVKWRPVTGGSDGLIGIPLPDLGIPGFSLNQTSFYFLVLVIFVICFVIMYRLIHSPFGLALQAIRDDEGRLSHLGYNIWLYKIIAFIIAGAFAGTAGVLFGPCNGIMDPSNLGVTTSVIAVLMVILGGTRIIYGPVIGAAAITILENLCSVYAPERWPLILGSIFVATVIFLRGGITIHLARAYRRIALRYGSTQN
jgi:branched-chain amino acid transport system permease protein